MIAFGFLLIIAAILFPGVMRFMLGLLGALVWLFIILAATGALDHAHAAGRLLL